MCVQFSNTLRKVKRRVDELFSLARWKPEDRSEETMRDRKRLQQEGKRENGDRNEQWGEKTYLNKRMELLEKRVELITERNKKAGDSLGLDSPRLCAGDGRKDNKQ